MVKDIFQKGKIGSRITKNLIVRSATNDHLANIDGTISNEQVNLYQILAKNNVGTIITGHFGVSEKYKAAINQPLLSDDKYITGAKQLVDVAHSHGAIIYGQISQGGLNAVYNKFDINAVTIKELEETVEQFISAAIRLEHAGYDGVQVHLAHDYFLANVLDNTINNRNDKYGGNDENRFRLVKEILTGIKEQCGKNFDVLVKLSVNNVKLSDYDNILIYYTKNLQDCGIDAIELSGANFKKFERTQGNYYLREALLLKQTVSIPIILVGGVSERKYMDEAISKGIDFVSCARAFICEPEFVTNLIAGKEKSRCIKCWQCFKLYNSKYKNCVFLPESKQLRQIFSRI